MVDAWSNREDNSNTPQVIEDSLSADQVPIHHEETTATAYAAAHDAHVSKTISPSGFRDQAQGGGPQEKVVIIQLPTPNPCQAYPKPTLSPPHRATCRFYFKMEFEASCDQSPSEFLAQTARVHCWPHYAHPSQSECEFAGAVFSSGLLGIASRAPLCRGFWDIRLQAGDWSVKGVRGREELCTCAQWMVHVFVVVVLSWRGATRLVRGCAAL